MGWPRVLGRWALGLGGLALSLGLGLGDEVTQGGAMVGWLNGEAARAIAAAGGADVHALFQDRHGWFTRHAVLSGGDALPDNQRARIAQAVAAVPGMGGVHWASGSHNHAAASTGAESHDCAGDVTAILKSRSIRFADSSAAIDPASRRALDEVAAALRPCAGSVIAITGHTNASGDEGFNLNLSHERALAVRYALGQRGIDIADLRARGMGSAKPVPGLTPEDVANRRIEFSVIAPVSLEPTLVDQPGAEPARGGDALSPMPLWLEIAALSALTYTLGLGIGWALWGRRIRAA
ncbi:OmpA family protein [Novosphingobium terrae]|uniref:OmpA family protein n=1 Tax=Novosphingobium terrae TaxID=2726189 RepID=UPI0019816809|nr:OmpA family protein [Novosphingobium terrae]